jgi:hypothetical protein
VRFFFDECISANIAEAIRAVGGPHNEVAHMEEKFGRGFRDPIWIPRLREDADDWVIVSADPRITSNPANRAAWMESGFTAFFFQDFARRDRWVQLLEVVRYWPLIEQEASATRSMRGYLCPFKGKELRQIYPEPPKQPRKRG